ncbi:hypothetical protein AGDE_07451 [Angomonas deanei]|nr:hypothetical protein AGDE_07451 [Angomonas deanei]|eukprot:EPY35333.1 hypothetical protein AGDE_07451 [Angomonas deanei]
MSSIDAVVKEYLDTVYPKVGRKFAKSVPNMSKKRSRSGTLEEIVSKYRAQEDSSSDDEPVRKPVKKASPKSSPKIAPKKAPIDDDSSSDDEKPVKKAAAPVSTAPKVKSGPSNLNPDGTYRRFQRIDPTKVVIKHEELKNNRPQEHHLALRQNREMMSVKGKNFNKLKQKNKGKFYGAPLDGTVRAFKIPDSDEDE